MELRPYQRDLCNGAWKLFEEEQLSRVLGVLPTGGGKTECFAKMAGYAPLQPALILAHREELIEQAAFKIERSTGIKCGIEKADRHASTEDTIVVASVQTLLNADRLRKFEPDHFKLVVADEAHHALSESWLKVLRYFEPARILGVTATPHRGDKRSLGAFFQDVIKPEVTLFDLIRQGYLAPIKIRTVPLKITVAHTGSIISDREAASAIEPVLEIVADEVVKYASGRKCLIFLPLIATSEKFRDMLLARGLAAGHVDGVDEERKQKLEDFKNGKITHLCNAMLLTEGYDEPSVDCVICLRPTTSQALYAQMVGRGTRLFPGKDNLLLLDFLWLHAKHKLVRPAHLVASSDAIADGMTAMAEKGAESYAGAPEGEVDLEELHESAIKERESKLRKELESKARKESRVIDVMEYALDTKDVSLADFEASAKWEEAPASPRQLLLVKTFGIDPKSITCAGHAKAVIGKFLYRKKLALATPKQLIHLRRMGHPTPHMATEKEASAWLEKRWGKRR
jgi:superfamily II DNA or RNA helicase